MSKNKIALVDVDEVLVPMAPNWYKWLVGHIQHDNLTNEDYNKIRFASDRYDMQKILAPYIPHVEDPYKFWHCDALYDAAAPNEGSLNGMTKLKNAGFDIVIVTYVIGNHYASKERFIKKHFGHLLSGYVATKEKYLVHGDLLIDDRLDNLKPCSEFSPEKVQVLFNTKFNQFIDHKPDIVMNGWSDIDKVIEVFEK